MAAKQKLKGFSPTRRYKNDSAAVSGGVWRDYADGAARLLVARYQNPEHEAFIRAEREKHPEFTEGGEKADTAEAKAFFLELGNRGLAQFILKGWEGILDEDGETELKYSSEAAFKLLTELEEFSDDVFRLSLEAEQYRAYKADAAVKN